MTATATESLGALELDDVSVRQTGGAQEVMPHRARREIQRMSLQDGADQRVIRQDLLLHELPDEGIGILVIGELPGRILEPE